MWEVLQRAKELLFLCKRNQRLGIMPAVPKKENFTALVDQTMKTLCRPKLDFINVVHCSQSVPARISEMGGRTSCFHCLN